MTLPSDVADLSQWWKADALSLNDGDQVTSWTDSSGNGHTATTGGTAPLFQTGVSPTGLPAVEWTATNGAALDTTNGNVSAGDQTVIAVIYSTLAAANGTILSTTTAGGPQFRVSSANVLGLIQSTIGSIGTDGTVSASTWYVVAYTYVPAGAWGLWIGTSETSGTSARTVGNYPLRIGARNAASEPWRGYMGEIARYNRVLTDDEVTAVVNGLNDKWITGNATFSANTTGTADAAGNEGALTGTGGGADGTFTATTMGEATASGTEGALTGTITAVGGSASGTDWVDPTNATGAPDDTYATWTSDVIGATSNPLVISNFGTWADIPAGSTINSVDIIVQHHESHTGTPLESVSAQAYLDTTPLGTATNLTLSVTDRDDTITPTLTLAQLQSNTLAVHIVADRTV